MNTDPIADMLTRLRNAHRANHQVVRIPYSKIKYAMLQVMAKNKFVQEVTIEKTGKFQEINVVLTERGYPLEIKRISKPGQRIYVKSEEIPAIMNGLGIAILSTPKGIMSGLEAKKSKIGGEILCQIA